MLEISYNSEKVEVRKLIYHNGIFLVLLISLRNYMINLFLSNCTISGSFCTSKCLCKLNTEIHCYRLRINFLIYSFLHVYIIYLDACFYTKRQYEKICLVYVKYTWYKKVSHLQENCKYGWKNVNFAEKDVQITKNSKVLIWATLIKLYWDNPLLLTPATL